MAGAVKAFSCPKSVGVAGLGTKVAARMLRAALGVGRCVVSVFGVIGSVHRDVFEHLMENLSQSHLSSSWNRCESISLSVADTRFVSD